MAKRGRPKSAEKRTYRGCRFRESSWGILESLVAKYQAEAPGCVTVSQRMVLEALIEYADARSISFYDLVGTPTDFAATSNA